MVFAGDYLIAVSGGGGNGDGVGVAGADARDKGTEINTEFINGKGEFGESVIDVLETRFDSVARGSKGTWPVLTNSVGKRVVG